MTKLLFLVQSFLLESKNPARYAGFRDSETVRRAGIEPATLGLKGPCSAN
jgi:hypothetical protein